ncbi:MAG: bifunctional phosphopantothenoylcysteine decarboxylase/phosphopantothenate--cysteine ligase CoaBC [Chloroflexi bacterium]|nr:bifunctional phosphopantothenoylcysteine decarboxylase/phosphopantothenate--cysteine ligase CoaBC [Chloroflexota bacterium]MCC6895973.1 bifunctional phosphopantothenoylcysteine decarboxylase/phosphopantothenate--cysteine ligase CoaBC [Anaerolineae bacterium]
MAQETITLLQNKRILLAVTGSIAAYKAVDLASKLTQAGAAVDVIMTEAAERFVTPLTFQAVTGRPVYNNLWQTDSSGGLPTHIAHVGLAEGASLLVVAPATANTMAKLAHGLADDLLSVTALAARCPVVVAPAMDGGMYDHPATQANLALLRGQGAIIIEPETGRFASGLAGKGRLPETSTLIGHIRLALAKTGTLAGKQVVVTAGGTREPLDPVRFITNRSSGKQGYALAQAALDAGAAVTLITASDLPIPVGVNGIPVASAGEMQQAVLEHITKADALLMAAAVADFRPKDRADQKIKKKDDSDEAPVITLARTPDILMSVKEQRAAQGIPRVVVGFAAESEHLLTHARAKLERKGLDFLIANDITAADAGFEVDTNRVVILGADGSQTPLALATKTRIAEAIIELVASALI